jgi:hypothetical protein
MRLKQSDSSLSSEETPSAIICANNRLATAPPALCPVKIKEQLIREGFCSNISLSRAEIGLIIFRATERNPEWQRLPASSRKPAGDVGEVFKFTAQSMNVCVPRTATTIAFMSSIGSDLITIAFVPDFQSAPT